MNCPHIQPLTRREKRYLLASVHHMPNRLPGDTVVIAQRDVGTRPPFFFVPVAPPLLEKLDLNTPLYGFPDPMPVAANNATTYISSLAQYYLAEMRKVQPHGPYRLGGYCFGGLVAYEIAHQIRRSGDDVELLALVETPAPGPIHQWVMRAKSLSSQMEKVVARCRTPRHAYWWAQQSIGELLRGDRKQSVKDTQWFPDAPYDEGTKQRIKTALMSYIPRPYDRRVTLFFTEQGSMVRSTLAPQGGWGQLLTAGIDTHRVPGTHATVYQQATFAERLNMVLERLDSKPGIRSRDRQVEAITRQLPE